jgi:hypothetical protein
MTPANELGDSLFICFSLTKGGDEGKIDLNSGLRMEGST